MGMFDDLLQETRPRARQSGSGLFDDLLYPTRQEPASPGVLGHVADTGLQLAQGVLQGGEMLANAFGADNPVSGTLRKGSEWLASNFSDQLKWEQLTSAQEMDAAVKSGSTWEEVKAAAKGFGRDPVGFLVNAAGTSIPTIAAAFLPGGQGALLGRLSAMGMAGAAQGAGAVKGQIYSEVESAWKQDGASDEEAKARAAAAQEYLGSNAGQIALGAALGALAGSTGLEGAIANKAAAPAAPGGLSRVTPRFVKESFKEALPEGAQGGQEQLAANLAVQREGFERDTWGGVAGSATLEAMAGGLMGAASSPFTKPAPVVAPISATDPETTATKPAVDIPPTRDPVDTILDPTTPPDKPLLDLFNIPVVEGSPRAAAKQAATPTPPKVDALTEDYVFGQADIVQTEDQLGIGPAAAQTVSPFKEAATLAVYQATEVPGYEGLTPLSLEDADFEIEALQAHQARGKLQPQTLAQSEFGKRLDTGASMALNDAFRVDPAGTLQTLRDTIAAKIGANKAPAAADLTQPVPQPIPEVGAPVPQAADPAELRQETGNIPEGVAPASPSYEITENGTLLVKRPINEVRLLVPTEEGRGKPWMIRAPGGGTFVGSTAAPAVKAALDAEAPVDAVNVSPERVEIPAGNEQVAEAVADTTTAEMQAVEQSPAPDLQSPATIPGAEVSRFQPEQPPVAPGAQATAAATVPDFAVNKDGTLIINAPKEALAPFIPDVKLIQTGRGTLVGRTAAAEVSAHLAVAKNVPEVLKTEEEARALAEAAGMPADTEVGRTDGGYVLLPPMKVQTAEQVAAASSAVDRLSIAINRNQTKATGVPVELVPDAELAQQGPAGAVATKVVQAVRSVLNVPVSVVRNLTSDGAYHEGRVYLDMKSMRDGSQGVRGFVAKIFGVVGHEVEHYFENSKDAADRSTNAKLRLAIKGYYRDGVIQGRQAEEQAQRTGKLQARYGGNEVRADISGGMWLDNKFWSRLVELDNGSTARKVFYRFMQATTRLISAAKGSKLDVDVWVTNKAAVREAYAQAWASRFARQGAKTGAGATQTLGAVPEDALFGKQVAFSRDTAGGRPQAMGYDAQPQGNTADTRRMADTAKTGAQRDDLTLAGESAAVAAPAAPDQPSPGVDYDNGQSRLVQRLSRAGFVERGGIGLVRQESTEPSVYTTGLARPLPYFKPSSAREIDAEEARLIARAKEEGFFWGVDKMPDIAAMLGKRRAGGNEHDVYIVGEPGDLVVIRKTIKDSFGFASRSPSQYLKRIADYNRVFPNLQIRVIGVSRAPVLGRFSDNHGRAAIWTAQSFVEGAEFSSDAELKAAMIANGWEHLAGFMYQHKATKAIVADVHTGNVLHRNGELFPIDVIIKRTPEEVGNLQLSQTERTEPIQREQDPATRYAGVIIEQPILIEDTGQTATLRIDAGQAIADLDEKAQKMRRLLECLG